MRRFFSADSFWNTPLDNGPEIDPDSDRLIALLSAAVSGERSRGFWINHDYWTIPVYEATQRTPLRRVHQRVVRPDESFEPRCGFRHGPGFGPLVPVPDGAIPSREADAHLAVVDGEQGLAWDMWGARWRPDGELESFTGMTYRLDGPGVFAPALFPVRDGESLHCYGPSRHAGVPAIAGLILHDEIRAGRIEHKLAFASCVNAYQQFVWPAVWDDGATLNGIPEGAVLQLDPTLDLEPFHLSPAARVIARALQEYGMVDVDSGGGAAIYAEGLWGQAAKSWNGILRDTDLVAVPFAHYRVLRLRDVVHRGFDTWRHKVKPG